MAACSNGLASGMEDALDLSPAQVLACLEVAQQNQGAPSRSLQGRPQGTPEQFVAMFMGASQGQVSVSNG